ncbi:hypothetical protein HK096_004998 [Nowakowskiella sp. JEL0078]|nr:hypothetical protein HK096_004998 [Nowakowskiella sp. JEL0078]
MAASQKLVLFALDESDHSVAALNWTFETLLATGDKLTVVAIVPNEVEKDATISRVKTLLRAIWQTTSLTVTLSIRALVGKNPGALICNLVEELKPSLLVLGSAGKSHVSGIANAKSSVIVARLSDDDYARGRGLGSQERRRSKSPLVDVLHNSGLLS